MFLPDHKRIVYIPHIEYRLIRELYNLSCEGVYYCLYKEYFDSLKNKFNTSHIYSWYCHTVNAYYDLAIGHWCKIFGSYSEPTHYHKLLGTQPLKTKLSDLGINPPEADQLRLWLLKDAELTEEAFNEYHQLTKDYRDRNLVHRENSPEKINDGDLYYPKMEFAKRTFLSLIVILIKLAKNFPETQDAVNHYEFIYDDFSEKSEILDLIKKSIPNFLEEVNVSK